MCYAPANARPAFSIANSTSLQGFMSTGAWAERSRYGLRFSACFFPTERTRGRLELSAVSWKMGSSSSAAASQRPCVFGGAGCKS
jgi:hypothetical protein